MRRQESNARDERVKLPDTYIIGAPKAGTTSVAAWLAEHRSVFFSTPKEPFFWAEDYPTLAAHYGFGTLSAYRDLFDRPEARAAQRRAEGSTVYLYSQTAVPNIVRQVSDARFVVCLRNPADLLASYHRTQVVTLNEHEPNFGRAWRLRVAGSLEAANPIDPKLVDYPMVGRLGAAVERLLKLVPRERIHFILFDDLTTDSPREWRRLTDFLGLEADDRSDFSARNRSDSTFRYRLLRKAMHRPPAALAVPIRELRQWSRETDSSVVRSLKRATWKPEVKPELSADMRIQLLEYFRDDMQLLEELVGQDLCRWQVKACAAG